MKKAEIIHCPNCNSDELDVIHAGDNGTMFECHQCYKPFIVGEPIVGEDGQ